MSADHDLPRIVRSWLRENAHEDADRVLFAVLDQIDTTPQRRAGWLARRYPLMSKTLRITLVAAAALVVAVIGYQFLPSSNTGGPGQSATPSPTLAPTPSPSAAAAAFPPAGSLTVGRHSMVLAGVPLSIRIQRDGWISNGQWGIEKGPRNTAESAAFIFWPTSAPDNTFSDPCTDTALDPPAGRSAAELAAAVAAIPGIELDSGPAAVTVGGYPAQHVVITVPEGIGCAPDQFYLWYDADTEVGGRYATEVNSTIYVWIIDVDGTLVWIDGEIYAASGTEAAFEIQQIVDMIEFE